MRRNGYLGDFGQKSDPAIRPCDLDSYKIDVFSLPSDVSDKDLKKERSTNVLFPSLVAAPPRPARR